MNKQKLQVDVEYVLVPKEPTQAMLDEAFAIFGLTPVRASEIYKSMLAAAPQGDK